jgi:putative hydrolase of the HAD superfamily
VTVRAVFFDFGGVLGHWDRAWVGAFEAEHGLPEGGVLKALYGGAGWRSVEIGASSVDDWFAEADAALAEMASDGAALSGKEIWSRLWNDFDRDVIDLVHRLRATHKVGVLSNTTLMLEEHVLIPNGIHDIWDVIINSARVGVAKPDARIYEMAAETIGVAPAECVHIDDLEHNVRGAEAAGFQAILHRGDFGELTKALNALGVEC